MSKAVSSHRTRKLVLNADGTPWLFFDLGRDPLEQHNLADDPAHAQTVAELRETVMRKMREDNDVLLQGTVQPPAGAYVTPPESYEPR